jgi:hypothetical protein
MQHDTLQAASASDFSDAALMFGALCCWVQVHDYTFPATQQLQGQLPFMVENVFHPSKEADVTKTCMLVYGAISLKPCSATAA